VNKTRLPPAFGQEISAFPIFTDGNGLWEPEKITAI